VLGITDLFSQFYLDTNTPCNLRCYNCSVWENTPTQNDNKLTYLIGSNQFFKYYPLKKIYNIIGSEPFNHPDLAYLLTFLRSHKIKTFCWSNGLFQIESIKNALPYINTMFLHLPSLNKSDYTQITGSDRLSQLLLNIASLQELNKKIIINHPITPESIQELPEIYDFAYYKKIPCLFHYNKNQPFSAESIRYINRFHGVKNVYLLKTNPPTIPSCQAVPRQFSKNQICKNILSESINSVRRTFHL
jgi:MoaA/NifB/PqqE/SkfB family radical SAM enzyme